MAEKQDKRTSTRRIGDALARSVDRSNGSLGLLVGGKIAYINAAFVKEYGDFLNKTLADLFAGENMEQLDWLIANAYGEVDKIVLALREDLQSAHAGNHVMVQIWPLENGIILFSLRGDYSVRRLADLDELTHLPNRRKAKMLMDIEQGRSHRSTGFCLTMGDIDHFKSINDTHGHDVGDEVLKHVSRVITSALREGDWVARWGGEEFLILTSNSHIVTGMQPIERVRSKLEETLFEGVEGGLNVTMSFGIVSSRNGKELEELLHKSDLLLYEAKNNGRNRIEYESEGEIIWVASEIKKIIAEGGLQVKKVPVRTWDGGDIVGKLIPNLRGYQYSETERMLTTADRLRERVVIDKAIIKLITEDESLVGKGGAGCFFPLHKNIFVEDEAEVMAFLRNFPQMEIGIDATSPLPEKAMATIAGLKRPLVLYNYNAAQAPSHLLGAGGLSRVVFTNAEGAAGMLPLLKGAGVKCYMQLPAFLFNAEEKRKFEQAGFDGYFEPPSSGEALPSTGG